MSPATSPNNSQGVVADAPAVAVNFAFGCNVDFGDSVAIIGEHPQLGSWDVHSALRLAWSPQDVWRGCAQLPVGLHEFKVVVIRADKELEWEAGTNRRLEVRSTAAARAPPGSWPAKPAALLCWPTHPDRPPGPAASRRAGDPERCEPGRGGRLERHGWHVSVWGLRAQRAQAQRQHPPQPVPALRLCVRQQQ
jgi:hypothetical protein